MSKKSICFEEKMLMKQLVMKQLDYAVAIGLSLPIQ
jgi:hypothetical protein